MTLTELALLRHIVEKAREGGSLTITNSEKIELDSLNNYFNNLIKDIGKEQKNKKDKHAIVDYGLRVEINQ